MLSTKLSQFSQNFSTNNIESSISSSSGWQQINDGNVVIFCHLMAHYVMWFGIL